MNIRNYIKMLYVKTLMLGFFLFGSISIFAQSNTPCGGGGAPLINVTAACSNQTGTNVGATSQTNANNFGTPSCGGIFGMGPDVWYSFVAPVNGGVQVNLSAAGLSAAGVAVYSSDCVGTSNEISCSNSGMSSVNAGGLTPGQTYYIRIFTDEGIFGGAPTGTFNICVIELPPPPPGENCASMQPICTDAGVSFTANTGISDASVLDPGNNYGCLGTQPNPTWFFLEIEDPGDINMSLTAGSDIDFIIWGPFANLSAAQAGCGSYGGNIDCSFSTTNNETPSITGAQTGEVYVMLVTNYANVTQQIDLVQSSGAGSTNCSIVFPSCVIDNMTANVSACNPADNTYSVSGIIDVTDPPSGGTLIIEDCNGNQQVINAPFAASINYSITGLNSDGAACDVHAYFTNDLSCEQTLNFTAPAACNPNCNITSISVNTSACLTGSAVDVSGTIDYTDPPSTGTLTVSDCQGNSVVFNAPFGTSVNYLFTGVADGSTCAITAVFSDDGACTATLNASYPVACGCTVSAGTFTTTVDGVPATNNEILCFGETIDIVSNLDYIYPGEATAPPNPGGYDPAIGYLIYSCAPTIFPPGDLTLDPCFVGVVGFGDNFDDDNNLGIPSYVGSWTNSTMYYVPITFYDQVGFTYSYVNTSEPCWGMGQTIQVQYLEEITYTEVPSCTAGTQTVTLNGGLPAMVAGELFTASNLTPANANFVNTTALDGGTIVIDGLVDGDVVSFDVTDANGCPITITLAPFVGPEDPGFSYPQYTYCSADADPSAAITGDAGSFTSAPGGLVINAGSGLIDLSASTPGVYSITYTTNGATSCFSDSTVTITINETPTVNPVVDQTLCVGENSTLVTFTGTPAGVSYDWVSDNTGTGVGASGSATIPVFTSTNSSTIIQEISVITVTPTLGACVGTPTTFNYIVNPLPTINAGPDLNICVGGSATLSASGANIYTWDQGVGVGNNIPVSPAVTTTYVVTGIDLAGCVEDDTITVNVGSFIPTVSNDTTICAGFPANISGFGAVTYNWDNGLGAGQAFSVTPAVTTTYTVTATDAGGCVGNASVTVSIDPLPTVDPIVDQALCIGANTTLVTFTGTAGATFDWVSDNTGTGVGAGGSGTVAIFTGLNPNSGIPEISTITVTPTSSAGCVGTPETFTITVNPLPNIDAGPDISICAGGNAVLTGNGAGTGTYSWDNGLGAGNNFNVSPAVATTYVVVGTDANGCVEDDTIVVSVGSLIPTISPAITICNGDDTTITANGGVSYTWDQGLGAGQSHLVNPVVTTTYTVTATDGGGCSGPASVTVTVNALPNVVADPDVAICIGASTTFNVAGATNYVWDNGLPATSSQTVSPIITTTYNVTGTDVNGCINTDQIIVTVNPLPTINAGPDLSICTGASTILTAVGGTSYVWDNGLGAGNNFNVTPAVATTYIVVGTDANGCVEDDTITVSVGALIPVASQDTTICAGASATISAVGGLTYDWDNGLGAGQFQTVSPIVTTQYIVTADDGFCQGIDSVTVTVNALPNVVADPDITMCINEDTLINAIGAVNYSWDNGIGNGQSHTVTPIVTTTYVVTGTDGNGCVNTDQMIININPLPIIGAGLDQVVCPTEMVTLSGSGGTAYVWDNGVNDGVAFVAPLINTIYTVTGTDVNGCVNTDQVLVTISANPPVNAGLDTTICIGEQVTLTGSGADTYSWDNGLGIGQVQVVNPIVTTTYILTGTTLSGCVGADTIVVTVNPLPLVDAGTDVVVCEGESVTLSGSNADVYLWDNGITDGVAFTAVGSATYTVVGTDINGCVNTDQVLVTVNVWDDSTYQYDASTFCVTGTDPVINFTGTPAGTFTSTPAGLTLNAVTGAITLASSANGNYTVTYTTPGVCPTSLDQPITITSAPIADFTFTQYCHNDTDPSPTFINNGTGGVFSAAPVGLIIDAVSGLVDLSASTPGVYTITNDINIFGCAAVQSQSPIEIFALPTLAISGGGTICQGEPIPDVQFDMTGVGDFSFQYNFTTAGAGNVSTSSNPYVISNSLEGQYDLVSVTDNGTGCTNTAVGSVSVVINPTPVIDAVADVGICDGQQYTVPSFGSSPVGATFTWVNTGVDVGFGMSGTGSIGTFVGVNTTNGPLTAQIIVTPTIGSCVGATTSFFINVNPLPIIDIVANANPTCLPVEVIFSNNGTQGATCLWAFGDGEIGTDCGPIVHTYTSDGCYDVSLTVTDGFGCVNSATTVDAVCLEPNPIANFVFNPSTTDVADTEISFENLSENASSYVWDFGDQSGTSNVEHPVHIYGDTAQEYIITLVAINDLGCTDTAYSKIIIHDVLLYWVPNAFTPDNDEFNQTFKPIFTSGFDPYDYNLLIFDRWGELIFESHNSEVGWDGRFRGNFVQDGVYVWKIEFKETMTDKRHKVYGHVTILR